MTEDQGNRQQGLEFGTNGAVLNAPSMSEELRNAYIEAEPLKTNSGKFRPVTVAFFIIAIFVLGFALGLEQGGADNPLKAEDFHRASLFLLFSGLGYEGISRHNLKKRNERFPN